MLRLQLGQTHSLLFHWLKTCPKMSNPGWSTISGDRRGVAIRAGRRPSPLVPTRGPWPIQTPCLSSRELQALHLVQFPEKKSPSTPRARLDCSPSMLKLTKILHAIRVCVVQEEVATLDSPVYLKAESQTGILDQVRIYLLSDGLGPGENIHGHESHSPLD